MRCLYSMIFLFEKHINSMGDNVRSNVVFWYQEKFLYSGRIFVHFVIFIYFCTHSQISSKKFFYYSVCWYLKCELCNGMGLSLRISDVHIINWRVWIHAFCHCSFRKLVRLVSNYCLITRTNFTICIYTFSNKFLVTLIIPVCMFIILTRTIFSGTILKKH